MPKARTFTEAEHAELRAAWPNKAILAVVLCSRFRCSSKTLVREVQRLGLQLRKPQWNSV